MQFPLTRLKESQILKRLECFFEASMLTQKAITTGFVKRKSKLCALSFLQLCLIHTHTACTKSLSEACTFLREILDVKLRKQSLDSRFNISAVSFIRNLVEELIKSQICIALADSNTTTPCKKNSFKRILIGDSTAFSLPSSFTTSYKGSGGMYSTSAIKLYYEYDLLSGSLNCLTDANGVRSDQTFNEIENIHKGDLVMKDLGFYQMPFFRKLKQKGAYFITRLPARSKLFIFDKRISLESLLTSIPAFSSFIECKVKVGADLKERTALGEVRLILEKVPSAVSEQRIRKVKAKYIRRGRQPSKEQLIWSKYNIFITNAPVELLPLQQVKNIYRLRWQIEILFKTWKSVFHINQVKSMQLYRFQCMLLSSLLILLLFMPLLFFCKQYFWQKTNKEVSEWKMIVWLKNHLLLIREACKEASFTEFARLLFEQILQDGFKEKRKKHGEYTHLLPFEILTAA